MTSKAGSATAADTPLTAGSPAPAPAAALSAAQVRSARTRLLLTGPIGPTLLRLAGPNVLAMFVMAAVSIAEGYFAAMLGVSALAGLALVFPLVMLTQMLSGGAMGGAISGAIARALGNDDSDRAGSLVFAAWIIATCIALLFALLMGLLGRDIFELLGGGPDAVQAALSYAGVFFPGCIAVWLCHSTLSTVRGAGNMGVPSLLLFCVSLSSIPVSGALSLGWGPFPALGMQGLAAGHVIAYGVGAVIALGFVASGRIGFTVLGRLAGLRWNLFGDILRVGLFASLSTTQTVLTTVLMVALVGRYGESALAGYGLGSRLEFLMIPIVFGIGAAMTAMVGANIGAGQRERALRVAWTGSLAAAVIVGSIGLLLSLAPDLWLRIFLDATEVPVLEAGRSYFRTVAPFYPFYALGLALFFASQGASRMGWPMIASICRIVTAFGLALLLTRSMGFGVEGVFAGIAAGMLVYGILTALSVRLTGWR